MKNDPGVVSSVISIIVLTVFLAIGLCMMVIPPKRLLKWEGRSGYWVYRRELAASRNEQRAVAAAGRFYNAFGIAFAAPAAVTLLLKLFGLL